MNLEGCSIWPDLITETWSSFIRWITCSPTLTLLLPGGITEQSAMECPIWALESPLEAEDTEIRITWRVCHGLFMGKGRCLERGEIKDVRSVFPPSHTMWQPRAPTTHTALWNLQYCTAPTQLRHLWFPLNIQLCVKGLNILKMIWLY